MIIEIMLYGVEHIILLFFWIALFCVNES